MAIELCVLASGSSGNCTVIRTPAGVMLVDAGIGPRVVAARLNGTGVRVADVSAICLTHLDRDHFTLNWLSTIIRQKIQLYCFKRRVADMLTSALREASEALSAQAFAERVTGFENAPFEPLAGLVVQPIHFAHDDDGSHGFVMEGFSRRIGYATDLGHVPAGLPELFCGLDVLCIESNYDPQMQQNSGRPWFLQKRIMGGRGHLSNEQAFQAVQQVFNACAKKRLPLPEHVVLLHRSRECNCPDLLRSRFTRDARLATRLTLAEQYSRTEWIRPSGCKPLIGEQLQIAWS